MSRKKKKNIENPPFNLNENLNKIKQKIDYSQGDSTNDGKVFNSKNNLKNKQVSSIDSIPEDSNSRTSSEYQHDLFDTKMENKILVNNQYIDTKIESVKSDFNSKIEIKLDSKLFFWVIGIFFTLVSAVGGYLFINKLDKDLFEKEKKIMKFELNDNNNSKKHEDYNNLDKNDSNRTR